jgi:hypothetical protein
VSVDLQALDRAWELSTRALDLADRVCERAKRRDTESADRAVFTAARLAFALFDRADALQRAANAQVSR